MFMLRGAAGLVQSPVGRVGAFPPSAGDMESQPSPAVSKFLLRRPGS